MSEYPRLAAKLQTENESLRAECALLRADLIRLSALHRATEGRLAIAEAEAARLRTFAAAVQGSRPWRTIQVLRRLVGRSW